MTEPAARCQASMDGVMNANRRYRCAFADDGHDRHRARTEFGEVWWTAPQSTSWVSPVATTSATPDDGYAPTRDAIAAAEARGRQQMIDALRERARGSLSHIMRVDYRHAADYLEAIAAARAIESDTHTTGDDRAL